MHLHIVISASLVLTETEFTEQSLFETHSTQGKGKVVPVLLTEHNTMKAYWGVEV
jgi:hypothetical protein